MSATRNHVATFFALAFTISWGLWIPAALVSASSLGLSLALFPIGLFGPALAAITLKAFFEGRSGVRRLLGAVLRWRAGVRWYLIVVLGPAAIVWVAANLSSILGAPTPGIGGDQIPLALPAYVLFLVLAATGEEIGWRGYALPGLQAHLGAFVSALIVGVMWALWHLPLFFIVGLPQTLLPFAPFLIWIVAQSVIFAWIYNSTEGSLLFPILLHAAINLFIQVFSILPAQEGDPTLPFIVLAGLGFLMAVVVLAAVRLSTRPEEVSGRGGGAFILANPASEPASSGNAQGRLRVRSGRRGNLRITEKSRSHPWMAADGEAEGVGRHGTGAHSSGGGSVGRPADRVLPARDRGSGLCHR